MSYDLYFWTLAPARTVDPVSLRAWFAARTGYQAGETSASYENQATGVYFQFEYGPGPGEAEGEEGRRSGAGPTVATFHLNYLRPSTFGLEAEPEVAAFVEHFGLGLTDPQMHGMGEAGPYDPEGFLRGWNAGNRFGYEAILADHPARWHLPAVELTRHWRWNHASPGRQSELGAGVFVPRIIYLEVGGRLATGAVWPEGMPTLLPQVDFVIAPRLPSLWQRLRGRRPELCLMPWDAVHPFLGAPSEEHGLTTHRVGSTPAPRGLAAALHGLPTLHGHAQTLPADQVLDRELVEAVASKD